MIVATKENVFVLRRHLLEYLGVKYDTVQVTSNDYSSYSKKTVYVCREDTDKMLILGESRHREWDVPCSFNFWWL